MKTLIVEDEFASRRLLQVLLSPYGECVSATNGQEAVEAIQQSILENDPYDLVCMDVMMPEMNGIEAVEKIRVIEQENNISGLDGVKIIMTTAKNLSKDIIEAFRAGCEAYVVKPIQKESLISEIDKLGLFESQNNSA